MNEDLHPPQPDSSAPSSDAGPESIPEVAADTVEQDKVSPEVTAAEKLGHDNALMALRRLKEDVKTDGDRFFSAGSRFALNRVMNDAKVLALDRAITFLEGNQPGGSELDVTGTDSNSETSGDVPTPPHTTEVDIGDGYSSGH